MVANGSRPLVTEESVDEAILRLETLVRKFERRYECASAKMAEAVEANLYRETADISRWLTNYRALNHLRRLSQNGHMTGTLTNGT